MKCSSVAFGSDIKTLVFGWIFFFFFFLILHSVDLGVLVDFKNVLRGKKMDRYQRVEKPREETPIDENEIRITSQGRMRSYITYAMSLLQVFLYSFPEKIEEKERKWTIEFVVLSKNLNNNSSVKELFNRFLFVYQSVYI